MPKYVCSMHPEETSDQPGASCSVCGMYLEETSGAETIASEQDLLNAPSETPTTDQPAED